MRTRPRLTKTWLLLAVALPLTVLNACDRGRTAGGPASVDNVVAGIHDPAMRKLWLDAQASNRLPPVDAIPAPEDPVTQRRPVIVKAAPPEAARPLIPEEAVIAVQPFSSKAIDRYSGGFEVLAHDQGIIRGMLREQGTDFEILYKLPTAQKRLKVERSAVLQLTYRDQVIGNALQRRIVLQDLRTKRAPLIAIAEGSRQPYQTVIKDLGLVIRQGAEGENPPVTIRYMDQSVTLRQGEQKALGQGENRLNVYLLNSYARGKDQAPVDSPQAYYVNIIMFQ